MAAALLDDDLVQAAKIAQDVKAAPRCFGATRLADVCAAVEVDPEIAAGRLEAMTVEYDRPVAELRGHLVELG